MTVVEDFSKSMNDPSAKRTLTRLQPAGGWLVQRRPSLRYSAGIGVIVACLATSWLLEQLGLSIANIVMLFVLAVTIVAVGFGTGPSIVAAVLASAMLAFFFLPPRFSLAVSDVQQVIMLLIMSILAVLISSLTDLVRAHAVAAEKHAHRVEALFGLSSELAMCPDTAAICRAGSRELAGALGREAFVVETREGRPALAHGNPAGAGLTEAEMRATEEVCRATAAIDAGRHPRADAGSGILPLVTGSATFGAIVLRPASPLEAEPAQLLSAMAQQIADALDRDRLLRQVRATQLEAETERLRSSLLSSITHDLRTPLAIITGAGSSLLDSNLTLPHDAMVGLCQNIVDYSKNMGHLVDNLLNMTRLESGCVQPKWEFHVLEDLIGAALTHMRSRWGNRPVMVRIPEGLDLVSVDDVLFQQVLVNLLENADAYSPPERTIEISAMPTPDRIVIEVSDHGPGLLPGEENLVFEKFFRGHASRSRRQGSGLGLTICRAIVRAHQGTVTAQNRPGGGLTVRVELPRTEPVTMPSTATVLSAPPEFVADGS